MKKLLSLILIATLCIMTGNAADPLINVAKGKKVIVSSLYNETVYPAKHLTDGNPSSGWASIDSAVGWAIVDLGMPYPISRIELATRLDMDDPRPNRNFNIEGSNSRDFKKCEILAKQGGTPVPFQGTFVAEFEEPKTYRYIRYRKLEAGLAFMNELRIFTYESEMPVPNVEVDFGEITEKNCSEAYQVLYYLGMIKEINPEELDKKVTGREFETFYAKLFKADTVSPESETVSTVFAAKKFLDKMGYAQYAKNLGKNGYMDLTQRLRLAKNISYVSEMTWAELYILTYNALLTNIYEPNTINVTDDTVIYKDAGKTLLESLFDLRYTDGVVNATHFSSLYGERLSEGYIQIGDTKYLNDKKYYSDYLGYSVRAFHDTDTDIQTLKFAIVKEDNSEIRLTDEEFKSFDAKNLKVTYGDKKKYIKLEDDVRILKNNSLVTDINDNIFTSVLDTELVFIDSDKNEIMDVVMINEITDSVIRSVSPTEGYKLSMAADFADVIYPEDTFVEFYLDGKEVDYDDIKECAVSVIGGNGAYRIYASSKKGESKVTGTQENQVLLDYDKAFGFSKSAPYAESDLYDMMGSRGMVYYNIRDKIVYIDFEDDFRYAYITAMAKTEEIDPTVKVKIFNEKGKFATVDVDEDAVIDGVRPADIKAALEAALYDNGVIKPQVIKYKININRELTEIETLAANTANKENELTETVHSGNYFYYRDGVFMGSYSYERIIINDKTKVFYVPDDANDEESFSVGGMADFVQGGSYTAEMLGYDEDGIKGTGAMVFESKSGASSISDETNSLLVTGVSYGLSRKDEETIFIKGMLSGTEVSLPVADEKYVAKFKNYLSAGDVIRCNTKNGEIVGAYMVYDIEGRAPSTAMGTDSSAAGAIVPGGSGFAPINNNGVATTFGMCYAYGPIIEVEENLADVRCSANVRMPINTNSVGLVYIFDKAAGKAKIGTAADIMEQETVLARWHEGFTKEVIIYK